MNAHDWLSSIGQQYEVQSRTVTVISGRSTSIAIPNIRRWGIIISIGADLFGAFNPAFVSTDQAVQGFLLNQYNPSIEMNVRDDASLPQLEWFVQPTNSMQVSVIEIILS